MLHVESNDIPPEVQAASQLPAGTPAWITPELVTLTIRVWQPFYQLPLTTADALTMLGNVSRLFGVLSREPCHEEIRRPGAGQ